MSGIDKIIRQIEDDIKTVCDEIIANAEKKADGIISGAEAKAEEQTRKSKEKTALTLKDLEARAESAADLEKKKTALKTRQEVIAQMLNKALFNMKNLPEDAYFDLILKMIEKNAQEKDGVIRFSPKDLDRLPGDFPAKIDSVSKGRLTLSDEPVAVDAGFVLVYGGIEENCSFDAIFLSEVDNLSDKANALLF